MKKHILTYLIFGVFTAFGQEQTERIEDKLMNCIYESYKDQGKELKKAFSDFEKLLIDENILKDGTGKSYRALFEKIIVEDDFDYNPSESFLHKVMDIGLAQNQSFENCQSKLREESKNEFSKEKELITVLDAVKNAENISPAMVANEILSVLTEKDFELEYYKMRVFFLFDTITYTKDSGISNKLSELPTDETAYDLSKAIHVYIDGNDQIFVDNEKVDIKKLRAKIRAYELQNESESIIAFKVERATMYGTYVAVQEAIIQEIQVLREELANEEYKVELSKLSEEQQTEIKRIYPKKIVE